MQRNDDGVAFSIDLVEFANAYFMLRVLKEESGPAEVTIVTPNSLQRDLIKEVYAKKRNVNYRFATVSPHVVSVAEVASCLPLDLAVYTELEAGDGEAALAPLKSQISTLVKLKLASASAKEKKKKGGKSALQTSDKLYQKIMLAISAKEGKK